MIGNDIVDLQKARKESNWQHPRFVDKIFTSLEKEIISASENLFQDIWRLWTMKESAYKVYVQQQHKTFFDPKKIECSNIDTTKSEVVIEGNNYLTVSEITQDYIYTTALSSSNTDIYTHCFETLTKDQSKESHYQLLKIFSERYQLNFEELTIQKDALGVPYILFKGVKRVHSISMTHHGRFAGIAL